jgi:hypothetical protein
MLTVPLKAEEQRTQAYIKLMQDYKEMNIEDQETALFLKALQTRIKQLLAIKEKSL